MTLSECRPHTLTSTYFRIEEPPSPPCQEKFEMEHSEKYLTGLSSKHDHGKSADKGSDTSTDKQVRANNKASPNGKDQNDVKASLMDSLAQLDPKALLLIQVLKSELYFSRLIR